MKKIHTIFIPVFLGTALFISCEEAEKDPIAIHTQEENIAPYVRIKGFQPTVASGDIAERSFEATVTVPTNNVASWELSVSLESENTTTGSVIMLTVTRFPHTITVPYTTIADTLGISINDIKEGDLIRFTGKATSNSGQEFTFEDYSPNITGTSEQLQAFDFAVEVH